MFQSIENNITSRHRIEGGEEIMWVGVQVSREDAECSKPAHVTDEATRPSKRVKSERIE